MRIYRMVATFGKLEHAALELEPGLNILQAPNEWGKSTWCAFLMAMLYGLDTRAKSTKTALADKERYAPWSGSPMEGRMDLHWQGKDITIERRTKGRIPLGEFRAYETATGTPVPELTAANCGERLLGAEQSVFRRAGFIRLNDMPVTRDEALRRRLNALVTTGDESGDGERLEKELRELRNRCRYNRTGLIPQAEEQRQRLAGTLEEIDELEAQSRKLKQRLEEEKDWLRQLENHRDALAYAAAEADAGRVAEARDAYDRAEETLTRLEAACARLPAREEAERKIGQIRELSWELRSIDMEPERKRAAPELPEPLPVFRGLTPEQAAETVASDSRSWQALGRPGAAAWVCLPAAAALAAAGLLLAAGETVYAALAGVLAVGLLVWSFTLASSRRAKRQALKDKYGLPTPQDWQRELEGYVAAWQAYHLEMQDYRARRGDLDRRMDALEKQRQSLCGGQSPEQVLELWQQVTRQWDEYHNARREFVRAEGHLKTLQAMAKTASRPAMEDTLTYSQTDTARLISDARAQQQRLLNRLGQYQGRIEALGDRAALTRQLEQADQRLKTLEQTYAALTLALDTLAKARLELQRRFAPRITKRAQELMGSLTGGRYDRLKLGEDLSLQAGAGEEATVREALWRSDGTVDQLYLALRLAVAEELTKDAPLVLDDALVRFDDTRLEAALGLLQEMAETKQVLLFTCQDRERRLVK